MASEFLKFEPCILSLSKGLSRLSPNGIEDMPTPNP